MSCRRRATTTTVLRGIIRRHMAGRHRREAHTKMGAGRRGRHLTAHQEIHFPIKKAERGAAPNN
jgi:hypothetical protein